MPSRARALFGAGTLLIAALVFAQPSAAAVFTTNTTITEDDLTYDGEDIIVSDATVAIDGPHSFNSLLLTNNAVVTHSPCTPAQTHRLDVKVAGVIAVSADSRIDVSAKGYLPGYTTGNTTVGASEGPAGASYGGLADTSPQPHHINAAYGDYANPNDWGSGSGLVNGGSAGGGLVRLMAQSLQLDGAILANGGANAFANRGAGGGVLVVVTNLTGTGSIRAWGLDSTVCCGNGGGGRIAVYASDFSDFNLDNISARGGRGKVIDFYPAGEAGPGTVYIRDRDEAWGTLRIDARDGGHGVTPLPEVSTDGVVVSGATLVAEHLSAPEVLLTNKAVLTHAPCTSTETHRLEVNVIGVLAVSEDSRIDVSYNGYLPGHTSGNTTNGASTGTSGGSYGGLGGGLGVPNAIYGDYADPEDWGSGGSTGSRSPGGGLVRITANVFVLGGMLLADGAEGSSPLATVNSGGSGGGIWVSVHALSGTGIIRASGGKGTFSSSGVGGGGGGGRVAIYAVDHSEFPLANVSAPGGFGVPEYGRTGTVHIVQGSSHTHVRALIPAGRNGGYISHALDGAVLAFNNPVNTNSFDGSNFSINGPLGPIDFSGPVELSNRTYQVSFPVQSVNGAYRFALLPSLLDTEGFQLDQNANGIPGEPVDDAYSFTLILDTVAPLVTQHAPLGDVAGTITNVDVWFSEAIDKSTLSIADVSVMRPDLQRVNVTAIEEVGMNRFRVSFPPQTLLGQYHILVGPDVRDLAGNASDQNQNGVFGEPSADVYDGVLNLVQMDLGLFNVAVSTNQFWAGDPITVSWSGVNRTGAQLFGDWTDTMYLSTDDKWDTNDILLATVPHSGGLTTNEIYSLSEIVRVPGVLPGNYYLLVRADVHNAEGSGEPANLAAFGPIPLSVRAFSSGGGAFSGVLTPDARDFYYAINVPAGQSLLANLTGQSGNGAVVVYVRAGAIPTALQFDQRASGNGVDLKLALSNSSTNDQIYYILVHGDQIDGSLSFDLSGQTGTLFLTGITPAGHGNAGFATLTLTGAGFDNTTTVDFLGTNGAVFPSDGIELVSPETLRLTLNLANWPAGFYSVRAIKGAATDALTDAFEVVQGAATRLFTTNTTITEDDLSYEGEDIIVSDATVTIDGPHRFNSLLLTNNAVVTHSPCTTTNTHKLDLKVANEIVVSAESRIDVTGKGYLPEYTTGNTTVGGARVHAGGSYGGLGGRSRFLGDGSVVNAVYGDYTYPDDWGSGGGGSPGGGQVSIVAHSLHLDGRIIALGADGAETGTCERGSGGAGGAVIVIVTNLTGNGSIRADGGNACPNFGSGGGGRVAVYASDSNGYNLTNVTALGGVWVDIFDPISGSSAGTVYLRDSDEAVGTLIIDARDGGMGTTPVGTILSDLVVVSGATLAGEYLSIPELRLTNNAVLTHLPCTATETHQLDLNVAGLIAVSTNSRIDVSGKGYVAGRTRGNTIAGAATGSSGGSYGGLGGNSYGVANAVYGDFATPKEWGSGSSSDTGSTAAGGGRLKLVAQSLQLDGQVLANGAVDCSGGSGGSVLVVVTNLTGSGSIAASGGNIGCADWGGGGGGRIAVYASDFGGFDPNNITALGGVGDPANSDQPGGGAGTIWIVNGSLHPVISPFLAPSGDFVLTFTGQIGRPYIIEVSTDLASWHAVTNFTSTGATIQFVDRDTTVGTARFYRVIAP